MSWMKKIKRLKALTDKPIPTKSRLCIHEDPDCTRCAIEELTSDRQPSTYEYMDEDQVRPIVMSLPTNARDILHRYPDRAILAGGYIRAKLAGEPVKDIDIFVQDVAIAEAMLENIGGYKDKEVNPKHIDVLIGGVPTQLVFRYDVGSPVRLLESFDYTIARAAIWYDEGAEKWKGLCHSRFHKDLLAKRLVFDTERDHERVESILRLIKFTSMGYTIDPDSLAQVVARTCLSLDLDNGFEGVVEGLRKSYRATKDNGEWFRMSQKYIQPKPKRERDYDWGS